MEEWIRPRSDKLSDKTTGLLQPVYRVHSVLQKFAPALEGTPAITGPSVAKASAFAKATADRSAGWLRALQWTRFGRRVRGHAYFFMFASMAFFASSRVYSWLATPPTGMSLRAASKLF